MNRSEFDQLVDELADRYRILRAIGSGATAIVYLAVDIRHDRNVAIKVLRSPADGDPDARRFVREIKIIAKLTHPHILPLLESGQTAGHTYYVTPFVEGKSLQDRLKVTAPLSVDDSLRFTIEIADALGYAHAAGVVHRDIKPGNVLLAGTHALVADFGAGRLTEASAGDQALTQVGTSIGTPLYMSPEQCAGEPLVDGRSDLYSLGCVIHEMLTGAPPFVGETVFATVALRFTTDPKPVRDIRPEVPVSVEEAILRALAREPVNRFQSMSEFAAALTPTLAPPPPGIYASASSSTPSIAVFPFANFNEDPSEEFYSRGVAEEIAGTLGRMRNLHVVKVSAAAGTDITVLDTGAAGRQLGVKAVLEGSVQRREGKVLIVARLLSVVDGRVIWSDQYMREGAQVLAVQEEVAHAVATALDVRLLGQGFGVGGGIQTASPDAHDFYLRGRHAWNKRTEGQLERSLDWFRRAIAVDDGFAHAHAGLADALVTIGVYGFSVPAQAMQDAKQAARRALMIDPTLAEAHASLACALAVYDWDWEAAMSGFKRAMALNPNYATAPHWHAINVLTPLQQFDSALSQIRLARSLDPVSPAIAASEGLILYAARRFNESVEAQELAIETEPHFAPSYHFLGQALVALGEYDRAIAAFRKSLELSSGSPEVLAALAHAFAASGDHSAALEILVQLDDTATRRYVSPYLRSQVLLALNQPNEALNSLERSCAVHAAELPWAAVRPVFDELRGEPRFRRVMSRLGLSREEGYGLPQGFGELH